MGIKIAEGWTQNYKKLDKPALKELCPKCVKGIGSFTVGCDTAK